MSWRCGGTMCGVPALLGHCRSRARSACAGKACDRVSNRNFCADQLSDLNGRGGSERILLSRRSGAGGPRHVTPSATRPSQPRLRASDSRGLCGLRSRGVCLSRLSVKDGGLCPHPKLCSPLRGTPMGFGVLVGRPLRWAGATCPPSFETITQWVCQCQL